MLELLLSPFVRCGGGGRKENGREGRWSNTRILVETLWEYNTSPRPLSHILHGRSPRPYRRPSLDFITGSGCNSTSLRTDSPRLANILHVQHFAERWWIGARLLYGFVGRDRRCSWTKSSAFLPSPEEEGEGTRHFHGTVKVIRGRA